ncbi:helix-turn-helix domain-containing protein [Variovorax atrisoli]|uniref:helix-turn-helix domain-containing protein n=1 Tax=Variovorax atrisoli TaxID=3394203 RepID=UPI0040400F1A
MSIIKTIRSRLAMTQQELADEVGCTQGNIANYERGQTIPPEMAAKVIAASARRGLRLTYDHIYGGATLPVECLGAEGAHA